MTYKRPTTLREWRYDEPGEELYEVSILSDRTVVSACGRYAQGSGARVVSWNEFLGGEMQELVRDTMGDSVLAEVLARLEEVVRNQENE